MELQDKVVIITGASGGIGSFIARALAARGTRMALVARSEERLNGVLEDITQREGEAAIFPCDIRHGNEVEQMVAAVKDRFGTVDVLVNSAFWGPPGSIEETDEEFWDKTLETTLKAPFLCTRAVTPIFKEKGGGRIVNIGSMAGKVGEDNRTAYCAAKWGLEGLSAALAVELGRYNIHVHLISPAATRTEWWPSVGVELTPAIVERMIPPEVVAEAVCWVLSQPDQVHIPDVAITNYRSPFEGKGSPFER
jgi:NAD(P)-dependent dehydrogenase (short-subunit alcohol dehydrogenase family)